jgi:hypothetical protein
MKSPSSILPSWFASDRFSGSFSFFCRLSRTGQGLVSVIYGVSLVSVVYGVSLASESAGGGS